MNKNLIQEMVDRTRRIETKVTRILRGDEDKGVTKPEYVLDVMSDGVRVLKLHSLNITLIQLGEILRDVPAMTEVDIFDDGRYIMTVVVR